LWRGGRAFGSRKPRKHAKTAKRERAVARSVSRLSVISRVSRSKVLRIDATDKQIDALVAARELYGLTEEEIRIVEGKNRNENA